MEQQRHIIILNEVVELAITPVTAWYLSYQNKAIHGL